MIIVFEQDALNGFLVASNKQQKLVMLAHPGILRAVVVSFPLNSLQLYRVLLTGGEQDSPLAAEIAFSNCKDDTDVLQVFLDCEEFNPNAYGGVSVAICIAVGVVI